MDNRIDVFEYIETAAAALDANLVGFTHAAEKLTEFLESRFGGIDATIGVTSRIKTRDSLKEKILRNSLYKDAPADRIVFEMHDIIGVKIECRFFKDEAYLYDCIKKVFCVRIGNGLYCPADKKAIRLRLDTQQPENQKNGYAIYRLDGEITYAGEKYNFELQIKSLVNSFWSEIEHKLIYKNNRLSQFDNLMKEMLDSTHESLTGIDHQLNLIFERGSGNTIRNQQEQLKSMIALGLNEMYTAIVKAKVGVPVAITDYSEAIVDYLITASSFKHEAPSALSVRAITDRIKVAIASDKEEVARLESREPIENYSGLLAGLLEWMKNIDYTRINIGEKIDISQNLVGIRGEVAKVFLKDINNDFYLNTFFHIFFSLERGDDNGDFSDYITYYAERILAGKTQDQLYRTLARLSEVPAHKLPLLSTIEMLVNTK